jgi:hypothetical protein
MLIDHIKYNNIINCISYLCNLARERKGSGIRRLWLVESHHPNIPEPRSSELLRVPKTMRWLKHLVMGLFPGVFDIKIIIIIYSFGLRSFTLQEL